MTEAMLFLQKTILLSYDPRPFGAGLFYASRIKTDSRIQFDQAVAFAMKIVKVMSRLPL